MSVINNFKNDYDFLSNFYPCQIEYHGLVYDNVECAFQAQKCLERSNEFCHLLPVQAKHLGKQVKLRSDWEDIKLDLMKELLMIKFSNPKLKEKLLATGDAELIEGNNWRDYYWGMYNNKGQNHLGRLLMQVREVYKC